MDFNMEISKDDLTVKEQDKIEELCEEHYDELNAHAMAFNEIVWDQKWGEKFVELCPEFVGYESVIYEVYCQYGPK
jgi:hypothetical protein